MNNPELTVRAAASYGERTDDRFAEDTDVRGIVEETDIFTNIECGFRSVMLTATATLDDGTKVDLSAESGGGAGSPWLTFTVGNRYFRLDVRTIATALVDYVEKNPR